MILPSSNSCKTRKWGLGLVSIVRPPKTVQKTDTILLRSVRPVCPLFPHASRYWPKWKHLAQLLRLWAIVRCQRRWAWDWIFRSETLWIVHWEGSTKFCRKFFEVCPCWQSTGLLGTKSDRWLCFEIWSKESFVPHRTSLLSLPFSSQQTMPAASLTFTPPQSHILRGTAQDLRC